MFEYVIFEILDIRSLFSGLFLNSAGSIVNLKPSVAYKLGVQSWERYFPASTIVTLWWIYAHGDTVLINGSKTEGSSTILREKTVLTLLSDTSGVPFIV